MSNKKPLSREAILATQSIRTLLGGPDDPKLAIKMAEIIDARFATIAADNAKLRGLLRDALEKLDMICGDKKRTPNTIRSDIAAALSGKEGKP